MTVSNSQLNCPLLSSYTAVTLKITKVSRWEILVTLNLSLKLSGTFIADTVGPAARLSELNFIITAKTLTDVKLKFQLRDPGYPSKSFVSAGVRSSPAADIFLTGRGSYHVTLAQSEIEEYSYLQWVLLKWRDICSQGSKFHHRFN